MPVNRIPKLFYNRRAENADNVRQNGGIVLIPATEKGQELESRCCCCCCCWWWWWQT